MAGMELWPRDRIVRWTTPARVMVLAVAVLALLTAGLATTAFVIGRDQAQAQAATVLGRRPLDLDGMAPAARGRLIAALDVRYGHVGSANDTLVEALYGADGRFLAGAMVADGCARPSARWKDGLQRYRKQELASGEPVIGACFPLPGGGTLFRGERLGPYEARMGYAAWIVMLAGLGAAITLLVVVRLIDGQLRRRLTAIEAVLDRIGQDDTDARLPVSRHGDEIDRIALRVNAALDHVARLMAGLRSLNDHVAHELKGGVGRLQRRLSTAIAAPAAETPIHLEACEQSVRGLLDVIDALLNLTAVRILETGRWRRMDLAAVIRDTLVMLAPIAEERRHSVQAELMPAPLNGDPGLIAQLFANLFENAVKYTPEGGSIRVQVAPADGAPGGARVVVEDDGPGVPVAMRDHVFAPRRRLVVDEDRPGYGYGLALARAIAEHHHGWLSIENSERGSRFVAIFPGRPGLIGGAPHLF